MRRWCGIAARRSSCTLRARTMRRLKDAWRWHRRICGTCWRWGCGSWWWNERRRRRGVRKEEAESGQQLRSTLFGVAGRAVPARPEPAREGRIARRRRLLRAGWRRGWHRRLDDVAYADGDDLAVDPVTEEESVLRAQHRGDGQVCAPVAWNRRIR